VGIPAIEATEPLVVPELLDITDEDLDASYFPAIGLPKSSLSAAAGFFYSSALRLLYFSTILKRAKFFG
jgi:hypothetical protein